MLETDSRIQSRQTLSLGGTCFQSSSMKSATYNIFCCHYGTLVLNLSLSTLQNLPSPLNYGWKSSDEAYLLILADELPASLALIELSLCSCKTKCATYRCICRKDALQCMDMCKCGDCENDDAHDASDNELKYLITEDKEHA